MEHSVDSSLPTDKLKLLVLSSTYPRWDDDWEPAFVHELSKRLTDNFEVTVHCPREKDSVRSEIRENIQIFRYRYAPNAWSTLISNGGIATNLKKNPVKWALVPLFLIAQIISIRKVIKQIRPDVIHAHWIIPQGLALCIATFGIRVAPPFLLTSHGADLFSFKGTAFNQIKRWVIKKSEGFTVVSQAMKHQALELVGTRIQIGVQPMGVDLRERFYPIENYPRKQFQILSVGRLVEKKGLIYLIEAIPSIIKEFPETELKIVGSGPELENLKSRAKDLGILKHVNFYGAVKNRELPSIYRSVSVFVAPFIEAKSGDQEGLGLVVIEAIGAGCPAVVSDIPAARDIVELFPKDSLVKISQPKDPIDIAKKVREILLASSTSLRKADVEILRNRFDWHAVATNYTQILTNLAKSGQQCHN